MKPFTLLALVCTLGTACQMQAQSQLNDSVGQSDSSKAPAAMKKWSREIGLNVYSSSVRGGNFYSDYKPLYDHYAASGLSLKFFHGKSAIRSSVDYFQKIILNSIRAVHERDISFKTLQVAAGYQRYFGNKRVMPYVFTDLSYSYGKELTRVPYYNELYYDTFLPYPGYIYGYNMTTVTSHVWSASPGIGLRLRLGKNIILNFETAAEFFYMKDYETYNYKSHRTTGINLKPLKCSFGFTF
jgi:hypothetical protein